MRGDIALGASGEGHRLGRVELCLDTLAPTDPDWIEAVETRLAAFQRFLPRLGETHGIRETKPHLPKTPAFVEAEKPAFCTAGVHLQKESDAVPVVAAAFGLRDRQRGELPDRPCHQNPFYYPSVQSG
jgi:hypothetical protein